MFWFAVAGAVVALVLGGGVAFRWMMERPLFRPGTVEQRVQSAGGSLAPPAGQRPDAAVWQVAPDVRLRHVSVGRGKDLVVVHGGPGLPPAAPWRAAELSAEGFRWHFYDQRGCGGSTRPIIGAPSGGTWKAMQEVESRLGLAEQLADIERIRRILGRERIALVGHSFGALIAALYAAEWPERVSALVLIAPAPLVTMPVEGGDLFALVRARLDAASRPAFDSYLKTTFDFPALVARDEAALAAHFGGFQRFYGQVVGGQRLPGAARRDDPGGFMTLALYLSLGRRHDWRPWLQRVRAPVVVLHGREDLQPRAASEGVARAIPGARFVEVPGAGHFVQDERPEQLVAVLRSLAEEIEP
jgi:proline iminopeptidase